MSENQTWLNSPLFQTKLSRLELQRLIMEYEEFVNDDDPSFVRDPYTMRRVPRIKAIRTLNALRELEERRSNESI